MVSGGEYNRQEETCLDPELMVSGRDYNHLQSKSTWTSETHVCQLLAHSNSPTATGCFPSHLSSSQQQESVVVKPELDEITSAYLLSNSWPHFSNKNTRHNELLKISMSESVGSKVHTQAAGNVTIIGLQMSGLCSSSASRTFHKG